MSFKDRAGLRGRPRRDEPVLDDPFNPPVTHCPRCAAPLDISPRNFSEVAGLIVGACRPCNIVAALTEQVQPAWRCGDASNILDTLTRDMDEGERIRDAHFSDGFDVRWTRL